MNKYEEKIIEKIKEELFRKKLRRNHVWTEKEIMIFRANNGYDPKELESAINIMINDGYFIVDDNNNLKATEKLEEELVLMD